MQFALELFHLHYFHNETYRRYCELIKVNPKAVKRITDIPFLPIEAFKYHRVKMGEFEAEMTFESSGTTDSVNSKHFLKKAALYEKSFNTAFNQFYGVNSEYTILALLPSYLERSNSSLVYMVEALIKNTLNKQSGFYLNDQQSLYEKLNTLAENNQKILLIGVSFALLDFVENYRPKSNPNLIIMETGGMKGRRKEIVREELHEILKSGFHQKNIHSEYGMTELLSQAYSKGNGKFYAPNWMKVMARKQDDPFSYAETGENGALNIIDLANLYSCPFIQSDDLGKVNEDGSFEVFGRYDRASVRGCNLMVS